jgi:hypothetical protein
MNNQPAVRPTVQQNPAITKESEIVGASPTEQSRKNPLLSFLRRRKQNQMPELVAEEPNLTVSTDQSLARAPMLKRIPKPLLVTGGIVLFLSGLISMTEKGVLSIGLEKVYNSVGLEVLWGGLPKNSEHSLGKALIAMQGKSGFKVKGKINLNVNKAVESPVTTPLVSYDKAGRMATILVRPEKAILAVTEEDYIDSSDTSSDGTLTDEDKQAISGWEDSGTASDSASTDSSSSSSDESSSSDDSSTTTDDSSSFSDVQDQESTTLDDQESLNSYEEAQTDTKDVSAEIEGFVSTKGSEINLSVDKAGTSEINLKNNGEKLWVKSDKILFNESAEEGKWLEYSISALQDRNLLESALGGDLENVTVEGSKIGNQKIGNTRCYNYKIDELDIGNMLSDIGISSDMVQAISGNAWIGIKDKLIRRLDLKITPSSSGPVNSVELSLEFSDYGKENSFTNPSSSDVITDLSPFTPSSEEEEVEETDQADETTTTEENQPTQVDKTAENDQKRKADLATLKNALESYKAEYGKYPIAPTTLKLNIESNLISQKLAPDYITSLPKDPLDSEGWFYGYKSIDGKSYYVSARLENVNDPEIKVVDNINLYFLYNE